LADAVNNLTPEEKEIYKKVRSLAGEKLDRDLAKEEREEERDAERESSPKRNGSADDDSGEDAPRRRPAPQRKGISQPQSRETIRSRSLSDGSKETTLNSSDGKYSGYSRINPDGSGKAEYDVNGSKMKATINADGSRKLEIDGKSIDLPPPEQLEKAAKGQAK